MLNIQTTNNIRIFCALMQRNLLLIKRTLTSKLIDGFCSCLVIVLVSGYLLPAIGLPNDMITPLFLTIFLNMFFLFGFSYAVTILNEVTYDGHIFYLLTLPISKIWLFATYIITFIMQTTIIVCPTIILGMVFLGDIFKLNQTAWLSFMLMYFLSVLFFSLFMLAVSFYYKRNWFIDNLWPRRLTPLYSFGAAYFIWKEAYAFAPRLAISMLFNPITYIIEGLRSTFIGGTQFISASICMIMTSLFCILAGIWVTVSINKRLDPV